MNARRGVLLGFTADEGRALRAALSLSARGRPRYPHELIEDAEEQIQRAPVVFK